MDGLRLDVSHSGSLDVSERLSGSGGTFGPRLLRPPAEKPDIPSQIDTDK